MKGVAYRSAFGAVMYLMVGTRPDLAASVGVLIQFAMTRVQHTGKHLTAYYGTYKRLQH